MTISTYMNRIPRDVPLKMVQSCVATAAIGLFFGTATKVVVAGAAIAALATLVEAVIRPIITSIFPRHVEVAFATQVVTLGVTLSYFIDAYHPLFGVHYKITSYALSLMGIVILNFYDGRTPSARGDAAVIVL